MKSQNTSLSCSPAQTPELQQLGDRIKALQEQASIIHDSLCGLNSRLFGTGEIASGKNVPTPVPSGAFGYLFNELENLQKILNSLGEQSARLFRIA